MGTLWTSEKISQYHTFMASFISGYTNKIDCADLALEGLVEFAFLNGLPVKLKYFEKGKTRYFVSPTYESTNVTSAVAANVKKKEEFKKQVRINLGAENVIDNTRAIDPSQALAGDFLMMKRPDDMGHTRVIYSIAQAFNQATQAPDYYVIWYQGTYPPEVPSQQAAYLSTLVAGIEKRSGAALVYGKRPRAWNFDAFEK